MKDVEIVLLAVILLLNIEGLFRTNRIEQRLSALEKLVYSRLFFSKEGTKEG